MANSQLVVGLTGGIASGKSQVSQYFTHLGVEAIDADRIAKNLFAVESPHLKTLKSRFGGGIFLANDRLDRKALAHIVFSDKHALKWLNDFTHPLIYEQMKQQITDTQADYTLLDIPLLINTSGKIPQHLQPIINRVLVVDVNDEVQFKRLLKRDKLEKQQALKIITSQSTRQQKLALADDIIDNNGDLLQLEHQVESYHQQYLNLARANSRNLG